MPWGYRSWPGNSSRIYCSCAIATYMKHKWPRQRVVEVLGQTLLWQTVPVQIGHQLIE